MRNPVTAAWDYLRGRDLQDTGGVEHKLFQWPDPGALIVPPTVITSGPAQWMYTEPVTAAGDSNSAVWACLLALSNAHIEPVLKVWRGEPESASAEWLSNSPLQQLLSNPNPDLTALEVSFWTSWAKHSDGNAYLRKIRSGNALTGNVIQLQPLSPRLCKPMTLRGSTNFIDFYRYSYAPGKWDDIDPTNIIHFKIGVDDRDMRLGLSPIKRLVREIASDQSATQFTDALLRNFGIPGLVVTVPANASLTDTQADEIKQRIEQRFGFENRGNVGVLTAGATIQQFGFSPEQLNMKELHEVPETRICAVMQVPPAIAGLSSGLGQSQNFASMRQIRENFTELSLIPMWRMDQAKLNHSLKPDFSSEANVFIGYDLSKVRALQEDRTELFTRLDNAVRTGWLLPNEARAEVGLQPQPWGEQPMPQSAPPVRAQTGTGPTGALPSGPSGKERNLALDADTLQALVEAAEGPLEDELQRFFDGQRRRMVRNLTRP